MFQVYFNEEFYRLRRWTNAIILQKLSMAEIRQTSSQTLQAETFKDYIAELFPCQNNSSALGKKVQASIVQTQSIRKEKLTAFACNLFPPVKIIPEHLNDTQRGDIFPQFSVSVMGKKYFFDCRLCEMISGHSKRFEGVSQMYQHAMSNSHKNAVDTATGRLVTRLQSNADSCTSIMLRFLGKSPPQSLCDGIWDPSIVQTFENDQVLNRMSLRKMFNYLRDETKCTEHEHCSIFEKWTKMHPDEFTKLKQKIIAQSAFIPEKKIIKHRGKEIRVNGVIKSLIPACDRRATVTARTSDSLYLQSLCNNCYTQLKYLKNLSKKRKHAALDPGERLSSNGMRRSYLSRPELHAKLQLEKQIIADKTAFQKKPFTGLSSTEWLTQLEECCKSSNQKKFIIDCLELFKRTDSQAFQVQMDVLNSIIGTLRQGRNHHYSNIIKRVAKMSKNWLGASNYSKIQVCTIFKL